jgi:SpoVK/Ycf46/Vps4 family AAA+-type ATPase
VIIVDEADSLLNTMNTSRPAGGPVEKGRLNAFLDTPKAHVIWIANSIEMVEESTLRRFSYSLYFRGYSLKERRSVWRTLLEHHPMKPYFPASSVEALASEFDVTAGGIASALNGAVSVLGPWDAPRKEAMEVVRELLARHEELVNGSYFEEKRRVAETATEPYDVMAVNTDIDIAPVREQCGFLPGR